MAAGQQDRHDLAARILDYLGPELAAEGYDLIEVRVFQGGGRQQIRLYVDLPGQERIDLARCAEASRSASLLLEAVDMFPGPWILEVSSPGICRPLRREEHFQAAIGSDVRLKWRPHQLPGSRPQSMRGRLVKVAGGNLTIVPAARADEKEAGPQDSPCDFETPELEPIVVPLKAVLEANLDRDVDVQAAISQDRRRRRQARQENRGARRRHAADASRRAGRRCKNDGGAAEPADGRSERQESEDERD